MKFALLFLLLLPFSAFADWKADVALGIDGETWKMATATFEEAKEKTLELGRYIVKLTIKKSEMENGLEVSYEVKEKKGEKEILINKGSDIIEKNKASSDIYAKGEPNQPHTIINFKFKK